MSLYSDKVTEMFYLADEFCKEFEASLSLHLLGNAPKRKPCMSDSEVITLMTLFHLGSFRNMKRLGTKRFTRYFLPTVPRSCSMRLCELPQS